MISKESDKIIKITKKKLVNLTFKVICDLVDLTESQVDKNALKSDIIKLIDKNLNNE